MLVQFVCHPQDFGDRDRQIPAAYWPASCLNRHAPGFSEGPCFKNKVERVSEMTQQLKMLSSKLDDLSLIPGPQVVEEENQFLYVFFQSPNTNHGMHPSSK